MVEQVSAVNAQKVYSGDKKIFSGMTVRDAGKDEKSMQIFNFADKDENGKIDDWEVNRYDGPIIQYDNNLNAKVKGRNELTNAKYELYTGQKIEDVPKELRNEFVNTDINKDGELSLAEMARKQIKVETGYDVEVSEDMSKKDMEHLITQKRNEKKTITEISKNVDTINSNLWKTVIGVPVGYLSGALTMGGTTAALCEFLGLAATPVAAPVGIISGLAVGGSIIYSRYNNKRNVRTMLADFEKQCNNSQIQAEIEQLKKDNPWLAK